MAAATRASARWRPTPWRHVKFARGTLPRPSGGASSSRFRLQFHRGATPRLNGLRSRICWPSVLRPAMHFSRLLKLDSANAARGCRPGRPLCSLRAGCVATVSIEHLALGAHGRREPASHQHDDVRGKTRKGGGHGACRADASPQFAPLWQGMWRCHQPRKAEHPFHCFGRSAWQPDLFTGAKKQSDVEAGRTYLFSRPAGLPFCAEFIGLGLHMEQ